MEITRLEVEGLGLQRKLRRCHQRDRIVAGWHLKMLKLSGGFAEMVYLLAEDYPGDVSPTTISKSTAIAKRDH